MLSLLHCKVKPKERKPVLDVINNSVQWDCTIVTYLQGTTVLSLLMHILQQKEAYTQDAHNFVNKESPSTRVQPSDSEALKNTSHLLPIYSHFFIRFSPS